MIHIEVNDQSITVTRYTGTVNDKYPFSICVTSGSDASLQIDGDYEYSYGSVEWKEEAPSDRLKKKAEEKIKDFMEKWLFGNLPIELMSYNQGDWVKIRDEDDYFQITNIDYTTQFVKVKGLTGHEWSTGLSTIERALTDKEIGKLNAIPDET